MSTARRPAAVLGIDAGSSSLRWRLRLPDGGVASGRLGPLSGLSFLPDAADRTEAEARVDALTAAVRAQLTGPGGAGTGDASDTATGTSAGAMGMPTGATQDVDRATVAAAYAGVTGLSAGDAAATALAERLAAGLQLDPARITVVNDMHLAYRSAFEPGEGIVVYTGTGSIAVHLAKDGTLHRAGGHGYLIDDAGGGFWIGRHALRAVLRQADRHGAPAEGPLAEAVYATLGSREWPEIRARVYGGGRERLSALVPAVRHALAAGDRQAEAIVAAAGRELARLADALATRLEVSLPVALAGGAAGLGSPLRRALQAGLPPGSDLRLSERLPVEVAVTLAQASLARD